MSDDRLQPLRKLFSEPERLESLGQHSTTSGDRVSPLKVLEEAKSLDPPLNQLLVEVLKRGSTTVDELTTEVGIDEGQVNSGLDELELQGYITRTVEDGTETYSLASIWESEDFPAGPIIPLVYQYNLLSDEQRVSDLHAAIDAVVAAGDVVADLGAGAGILSFLAAQTADTVYSVEVDPTVYQRGRTLIAEQGVDNIEYIKGDARTVSLPERVDVVICEMLDTGLIAELQVPVMNHAIERLLEADGRTIPYRAKTTARLVESDYKFHGGEFRLPHFEAYGSRESIVRSDEVTYHEVCFEEQNDLVIDETLHIEATESGVVNGVQLNTYTQFARGVRYTEPSEWLNPPLTLPASENLFVDAGDEIEVTLHYTLAGGLDAIEHSLRPVDAD